MRRNIELVIEMLNEASAYNKGDMKWTLLFPIWISFGAMAFICIWVVESLYIYCVKTEERVDWPNEGFFRNNDYLNANAKDTF